MTVSRIDRKRKKMFFFLHLSLGTDIINAAVLVAVLLILNKVNNIPLSLLLTLKAVSGQTPFELWKLKILLQEGRNDCKTFS